MLATILTPSLNAAQVFALIALVVFVIAAVIALSEKAWFSVLTCAGLALFAAAFMFGG